MAGLLELLSMAQKQPQTGSPVSTMRAIPQDTLLGGLSSGLGAVRDFGNKLNVPYLGGVGDMFVGKSPEEIENWSYGNSPFQTTEMGLPQIKEERKQGLLDAISALAPVAKMTEGMPVGMAIKKVRMGDIGFDPRFDKRKLEQGRLNNLTTTIDVPDTEIQQLSLADYEGYPFITSMSDRTNVGLLQSINGVPLNVDLQGGQGYMFNNPGQVWASAKAPSNSILKMSNMLKDFTGKDPLFMPWRMAPTGGDFANMTGETMLQYMSNNMSNKAQQAVNKNIKNNFIPNFKGMGSEEGITQFRNAPDKVRKSMKNMLDKNYRNEGGLSIGEARLAVADPNQLILPDSGLQNVGQVFSKMPLMKSSGHKAYPKGVQGEGLGILDRDIMAYDLLPNAAKDRGIIDPRNPSQQDIRALQMKPYGGILTSDILKQLGY